MSSVFLLHSYPLPNISDLFLEQNICFLNYWTPFHQLKRKSHHFPNKFGELNTRWYHFSLLWVLSPFDFNIGKWCVWKYIVCCVNRKCVLKDIIMWLCWFQLTLAHRDVDCMHGVVADLCWHFCTCAFVLQHQAAVEKTRYMSKFNEVSTLLINFFKIELWFF